MAHQRLTDNEIMIRIVPKRMRWPESSTNQTWAIAHACASAFDDLIRGVDVACLEAEQDRELSATAIRRRRAELCDRALAKLVNFRPFDVAQKALTEEIVALERLSLPDAEQSQMLQKLKQARTDLDEGVSATQRMLQERCKVRDGVLV